MGPMSGRGMGFCAGYEGSEAVNPGFAARRGRGRGAAFTGLRFGRKAGFGPGRGFGGYAFIPENNRSFPDKEEEQSYLNQEISGLKEHLKTLEERLEKLKADE